MGKILLPIFAIILLILACNSSQKATRGDYGDETKSIYLYAFKMAYFKKILLKGFNNSDAIKNVIAFDHSGYGEPILSLEDYNLIDSLANADNSIMTQDSVKRVGKISEGAQGKHVFDFLLTRYQSKWLDSVAKKRYSIYKNSEK
jgi:hypothetical protein